MCLQRKDYILTGVHPRLYFSFSSLYDRIYIVVLKEAIVCYSGTPLRGRPRNKDTSVLRIFCYVPSTSS